MFRYILKKIAKSFLLT